jgi:hypothetical protein
VADIDRSTLDRITPPAPRPSDWNDVLSRSGAYYIREAIASGRAHYEGKTELDGRVVERIRIHPEPGCLLPPLPAPRPLHLYVDAETLMPVQFDAPDACTIVPGPDGRAYRLDRVVRFLDVEYLLRAPQEPRAHRHPGAAPERNRAQGQG